MNLPLGLDTLAGRLRHARQTLGVQRGSEVRKTELAGVAGVTDQGYGHYESGKSIPPLETIALLADYLQVNVEWLGWGRGDGPTQGRSKPHGLSEAFDGPPAPQASAPVSAKAPRRRRQSGA